LGSIYAIYCVLFCGKLCKTEFDERRNSHQEIKEGYDNIEIALPTIEEVEEAEEV